MSDFSNYKCIQLKPCFAGIFEALVAFPQRDALQLRPPRAHSRGDKIPKLIFSIEENSVMYSKYRRHFDCQDGTLNRRGTCAPEL
jgi:hypothetical protein